jgi:site-specific recombinase XerD
LNRRMGDWLVQCELPSDAFTPHNLRHSFATNLLRTGVPLDVACDLCNHSSVAITMRYVRTAGRRLSALRVSPVLLAEAQ